MKNMIAAVVGSVVLLSPVTASAAGQVDQGHHHRPPGCGWLNKKEFPKSFAKVCQQNWKLGSRWQFVQREQCWVLRGATRSDDFYYCGFEWGDK